MTQKIADRKTGELTREIGEAIRGIRESCGCSQKRLANRVGTARSSICAFERGLHSPSIDRVEKILKALGYTFQELMRVIEDQRKNRSVA